MAAWNRLQLIVPVFALAALSVVGCGPGSSSSSPPPPPPPPSGAPSTTDPVAEKPTPPTDPAKTTPAKSDSAKTTPDVKLTAEELYKESQKDGNYLVTKHAGKLVELTGVLIEGKLNHSGNPVLLLKGGPEPIQMVNCPIADRNPWTKAYPGQTVTLWGTGPSSSVDRKPFAWEIKSATGPQPLKIAAEDFVKEVVADGGAAEKKYKGKHIILTGEVAEPHLREGKLVGFRLKLKEAKPTLVCHVMPLIGPEKEREFLKGVARPGQKATVLVEYGGYDSGEISVAGHILDPVY